MKYSDQVLKFIEQLRSYSLTHLNTNVHTLKHKRTHTAITSEDYVKKHKIQVAVRITIKVYFNFFQIDCLPESFWRAWQKQVLSALHFHHPCREKEIGPWKTFTSQMKYLTCIQNWPVKNWAKWRCLLLSLALTETLFRVGLFVFGAAHEWEGCKKAPSLISVTNIL